MTQPDGTPDAKPNAQASGPPEWLTRLPLVGPIFAAVRQDVVAETPYADAALERHKKEGMEFAIRARIIAMSVIVLMLPFVTPWPDVVYYQALICGFILIGVAQRRVARVGQSRAEILLIFADIILMSVTLLVPNPLSDNAWPIAMQYRPTTFAFFFVFLAFGTLAYSWRTVWGMGVMTAATWGLCLAAIYLFAPENLALTAAAQAAFPAENDLADLLNPNSPLGFVRVQEIVAILLVAGVLAATVRRYTVLMMGHAALERERANLARYFSPNVVEQLSHNDDPLKQVRTQNVAVLFVDIVGFTGFAAERSSEDVIRALREFHSRMEAQVFSHEGTLDKYLGDGLMATFGTPFAGPRDATNAFTCATAMMAAMAEWNAKRAAAGEPELRAGFGLHYGPAVLGDIGSNRLEFAVVGNTVNVASRVEALTRTLDCDLAATAALRAQVERETGECDALFSGMEKRAAQPVRGLQNGVDLWTLRRDGTATIH